MNPFQDFHEKYIKGTEPKAIVPDRKILLCYLTSATKKGINASGHPVYIATKALKHLYDKKPAQVYDFIINNVYKVVRFPDFVYKNLDSKTGNFCFIKEFGNKKYFCSIQDDGEGNIELVTVFPIDDKYIKKYELLWSWRDGNPSS